MQKQQESRTGAEKLVEECKGPGTGQGPGSGGPVPPRSPGVPGLKKPVLAQGLGRHAGDCKGLSCGGGARAGPLLRV